MSKTWLITPAFCKAALLEECLRWLSDKTPEGVQHVIIDNHYPVDKERNRVQIKELADQHDCIYIDSGRDLGLHEGINYAARVLGIGASDIVVGCDPDDRPSHGFVEALSGIIRADPRVAIAAANFHVIRDRKAQGVPFREDVIGGHPVWIHPTVEMWSVCAFNWRFITEIGGLQEPHAYYGGLEAYLHPEWSKRWMMLAYARDVEAFARSVDRSDRSLFDPEYREWKTAHVGGYKGSFEQWLKEFKPERLL